MVLEYANFERKFWLQWVIVNVINLALFHSAVYHFIIQLASTDALLLVAASLVMGYLMQWLVLRQRFRRAAVKAILFLTVGCVVGVPMAMLISWPIMSWVGRRPTDAWYEVVRGWLKSYIPLSITCGAIAGIVYGIATGIILTELPQPDK